MIWIALTFVFLVLAVVSPRIISANQMGGSPLRARVMQVALPGIFVLLAMACMLSTSYVVIPPDSIGHMKRLYLGRKMSPGQVIALRGENGKSAETLPPGLHIRPFLNVLHRIEEMQEVEIQVDQFAMLTAADGAPLPTGQIMSDTWPEDPNEIKKLLDAEYFLERVNENGEPDNEGSPRGQKGMQNVVLPPGRWRFNQYLFEHELGEVTEIKPGFVGVVKSNIQEIPFAAEELQAYQAKGITDVSQTLSATLVPKGYKGVWGEPLRAGKHWMHKYAYEINEVDTRVKMLKYLGGFTRRFIDLEFDQEGNITQKEREQEVEIPLDAADRAITVKVEGWEIPVEIRVQLEIKAEHAPLLVATVGTLEDMEANVITPILRAILRDVAGAQGRSPLDLMNQRDMVRGLVFEKLYQMALQYGVTIVDVQIGEPAIPPELLVAQRRRQISGDLLAAYKEEKMAQEERIAREAAKAEADQQQVLVAAQIEQQAAEFKAEAMKLQGEGQKNMLTEIAEGQKAQAQVLGEDNVLKLAVIEKILDQAETLSTISVPNVLIIGGESGGLAGAAAVLSNALQAADSAAVTTRPAGPSQQ